MNQEELQHRSQASNEEANGQSALTAQTKAAPEEPVACDWPLRLDKLPIGKDAVVATVALRLPVLDVLIASLPACLPADDFSFLFRP